MKLLFSIANGFHLRPLLHSRVFQELQDRGAEIHLLTPPIPDSERPSLPGVHWHGMDLASAGPLAWRYVALRDFVLTPKFFSETLQWRFKQLRKTHFLLFLVAHFLRLALRLIPQFKRRLLRFEGRLFRSEELENLFRAQKFDALVTQAYGLHNIRAMYAAENFGVPIVMAVASWDNLTSQSAIFPRPKQLLAWGEQMKKEAMEIHEFQASQIQIVGAPLYDKLYEEKAFPSRAQKLSEFGFSADRKLLIYGTNHGGFCKGEYSIVKRIADWVEHDQLGAPSQLLIRIHPQGVSGPYRLDLEKFLALETEKVRVEIPPVSTGKFPWSLPSSDTRHLLSLLREADVIMSVASTFSLDAAVVNKPSIWLAFEPEESVSEKGQWQNYYQFTHIVRVLESKGIACVTSYTELQTWIRNFLENPHLLEEERRQLAQAWYGPLDGNSARRFAELTLDTLLRNKSAN